MNSYSITVDGLNFSAAHFLLDHDKCSRIHGHNYKVRITIEGQIEATGMVFDFAKLKSMAKNIVEQMDHKMLVPKDNLRINIVESSMDASYIIKIDGWSRYVFPIDNCMLLPIIHTTAECLTKLVFDAMTTQLENVSSIYVKRVDIWENDNSQASYGQ